MGLPQMSLERWRHIDRTALVRRINRGLETAPTKNQSRPGDRSYKKKSIAAWRPLLQKKLRPFVDWTCRTVVPGKQADPTADASCLKRKPSDRIPFPNH